MLTDRRRDEPRHTIITDFCRVYQRLFSSRTKLLRHLARIIDRVRKRKKMSDFRLFRTDPNNLQIVIALTNQKVVISGTLKFN